ncbi:hypothetical protein EYC80_003560 [Monilinia laxa]|uniref:Uncharacterized protein n=1 Tax=Monilinia laxa TaxID=61186 RepID=A0A5N6KK16_MONLA|nr:hypothetical protein EYC80_003560 [Monilinia laxa]
MPSSTDKDVQSCPTKSLETLTRAEAIDTILKRTSILERFLVHKNPLSPKEMARNGMEDESNEASYSKSDSGRLHKLIRRECEYNSETIVLRHRHIIASVNNQLNNLFRYTLEARLKILKEHRQDFQVDIETVEEYLFFLRKLDVADDKFVAHKINTALVLMAESSATRSNIELRIQEVDDFLSEASDKLNLRYRKQMMVDLVVRHGAYGSKLTLRDHEKFPQWRYQHLLDVRSLREQANGTKIISRQSEL